MTVTTSSSSENDTGLRSALPSSNCTLSVIAMFDGVRITLSGPGGGFVAVMFMTGNGSCFAAGMSAEHPAPAATTATNHLARMPRMVRVVRDHRPPPEQLAFTACALAAGGARGPLRAGEVRARSGDDARAAVAAGDPPA